jgi:3-(3-hydroxy-phenyl)propionate hydroxylase
MACGTAPYCDSAFTNGYEFTRGSGYALPQYPFTPPPELTGSATTRYPVAIVGAGIAGLTLACALAQRGIRAVLLDEDDSVGVKGAASRGICYTQKSLEIFQRLGIYERIAAKGIQWSVGRTFAGIDEIYSFDLRQQSSFQLSGQPPFINIQQFYIEGFLVERIQALAAERPSVDIRWLSRVVGFTQQTGYANLEVDTPAGRYTLEATHVIDASGSHTPFHRWCQAGMQARRGDDRWCIADVRFKHTPPTERHTWIEAPFNDNRAVWQHLMADDVWRIDYQMPPDTDPAHASSEAQVRARLARQFGPGVDCEIVWVGPYAYRSQCLDRLRIGSVFFMGDTAKVVSPFGARGGNTGVADADNLAWKLAAVLRGQAPAALLDSYDDERLEAARQNVRVTDRTTRFLRPSDGIERTFRTAVIGLARRHPFARQLVNTGRMAVANAYTQSRVCERTGGLSVQNVGFHWLDGTAGCVNDLLRWADDRFLLLCFGELAPAATQRLVSLGRHAPVFSVQVLGPDGLTQAVEAVRDPMGHLQGACHVFGHAWALVRPDAYLAATGEAIDGALVCAVERALGLRTGDAT